MTTVSVEEKVDSIPFQMHPRVFAALGSDLVTNDVVAIIELVKNSYDAFAHNVWVRFRDDPITGACLEIEDDRLGMTREEIENIWCLVATPHKQNNPTVSTNGRLRRVSGAKGLGRLAAGRDAVNSLCMEVGQCGEAVAKLGAEETAKHPLIFGKLMSSTRNNLFHDYPDMKYLQAWEVASSTVPRMVEYLSSILPDLPGYDPYRLDRGGYAT